MIMEVLRMLPLKPLARAQLVCKQWAALILDHHFLEDHMKCSPFDFHWYNVHVSSSTYKPSHGAVTISYLHDCDGLVLIKNLTAKTHMLWNPATGLVLDLPAPHQGSCGFALSFAATNRSYKIVSLFQESGKYGCELLTPGPSMAWRRLAFPDLLSAGPELRVSVVPAGVDIHCVVLTKSGEADIVSLDVESELLTLNHVGSGLFAPMKSARAIDWDGKLAFAAVVGHDLQVMVLQDYRKKRWCGEKEVIPLPFLKEKAFEGGQVVALFKKEGGIWFWLENEKIFVYTVEAGKVSDVRQAKGFAYSNKLYIFKPSLVTFEGMREDDELKYYRPRNMDLG